MAQFVTDRKPEHVELLKRLRKKSWADMTSSEKDLWYGEAAKGAYNHMDLNRVESVVAEIVGMTGLALTTKTNWTVWDVPLTTDMERYIGNVKDILNYCRTITDISGYPALPTTMNNLTLSGANNIEKVLELAYEAIRHYHRPAAALGEFTIGLSTLGGK